MVQYYVNIYIFSLSICTGLHCKRIQRGKIKNSNIQKIKYFYAKRENLFMLKKRKNSAEEKER